MFFHLNKNQDQIKNINLKAIQTYSRTKINNRKVLFSLSKTSKIKLPLFLKVKIKENGFNKGNLIKDDFPLFSSSASSSWLLLFILSIQGMHHQKNHKLIIIVWMILELYPSSNQNLASSIRLNLLKCCKDWELCKILT